MENIIRMLRLKLRNERIYRAEAKRWLDENEKNRVQITPQSFVQYSSLNKEIDSFKESLKYLNDSIPQLEKAIKILTEWKDK